MSSRGKEKAWDSDVTDLTRDDSDETPLSKLPKKVTFSPEVTKGLPTPKPVPSFEAGPSTRHSFPLATLSTSPVSDLLELLGRAYSLREEVETLKQEILLRLGESPSEVDRKHFDRSTPEQKEVGLCLFQYKKAVSLEVATRNFHTTAFPNTQEYLARINDYSQIGLPPGALEKAPYTWSQTAQVELNASWLAQTNLQIGILKRILDYGIAGKYESFIKKLVAILERLIQRYLSAFSVTRRRP